MSELNDLLDLLDLSLGRAEGMLDPDTQDKGAALRRRLRIRGHFIEEALTVAIAGGTGSGKSSLVNAIVGTEIVESGLLRPTTQVATAVVPAALDASMEPLIEALEVGATATMDVLADLVIVDLPDYDSIESAHREIVERVVPNVDVVIWVSDPEKYADPVVREAFLERMVPYGGQFLFVLNKVDNLGDSTDAVVSHFGTMLEGIGYDGARVIPVSAAPSDGSSPRIEPLSDALTRRFGDKRAALAKVALDLRIYANDAWAVASGHAQASGTDADALAVATFVSLGVAAYGLHDRVTATQQERTKVP